MILEIKKLIAKARYTGDFSFDFTPEEGMLLIPLCSLDGAVKTEGEYEIFDDDSVGVNLKLSYRLAGQCSYCLGRASTEVIYETQVLFVTEGVKDDEYLYDGDKLDLNRAVSDAFMISQPKVLLCKPDCKGINLS